MLKAYIVQEECEGTGGVVFARSNVEARRFGADEYNGGDFSGLSVNRAKGWDKYEKSGVPISEMIYDGWYFECHGCGQRMDEDWFYDQRMNPSQARGVSGGNCYCCWQCEADAAAEGAARKAYGRVFLGIMRDWATARFGDVEFMTEAFKEYVYVVSRNGHMQVEQAVVSFSFPGMEIGPASIRFDMSGRVSFRGAKFLGPPEMVVMCCNGDRDAFEKFAADTQKGE